MTKQTPIVLIYDAIKMLQECSGPIFKDWKVTKFDYNVGFWINILNQYYEFSITYNKDKKYFRIANDDCICGVEGNIEKKFKATNKYIIVESIFIFLKELISESINDEEEQYNKRLLQKLKYE